MKTVKSICLTLLILGTGFPSVQAQTEERQVKPTVEYSRIPRSYTIGGISVEGAKNYDDYMLIGLSGLTGRPESKSFPGRKSPSRQAFLGVTVCSRMFR